MQFPICINQIQSQLFIFHSFENLLEFVDCLIFNHNILILFLFSIYYMKIYNDGSLLKLRKSFAYIAEFQFNKKIA